MVSGLYKKGTMSAVPRGKIALVALLGTAFVVVLALALWSSRSRAARAVSVDLPESAIVGPKANDKPAVRDVSGTRPNILLIITDDQEKTSMRAMPQTLRLFKRQGVDFNHGYVTTPLCCPARATMYSGLYAHNHGILTNNPSSQFGSTYLWQNTFPAELQSNGYYTGQFGKYLNGWNTKEDGDAGFDVFKADYNGTEHNRKSRGEADILTARRGARFVKDREATDKQPWMMTLSLRSPHTPLIAEKKYQNARVPKFRPPISFNETDLSDKPKYLRDKRHDKTLGYMTKRFQKYQQTLLSADDGVAKVFRTLKQTGESRDTLAIYISDNGFLFGAHDVLGKVFPYQEATNVPLYMRWPAELGKRSRLDTRLVANVDFAPTFYDVAGIDPGYEADGKSLFDPANDRKYMLTESVRWKAIQDEQGSLIETKTDNPAKPFVEFYDWNVDPGEMDGTPDLSSPAQKHRFERMSAYLDKVRDCAGSACP
jgi:arylsulfatase A-like enzyme